MFVSTAPPSAPRSLFSTFHNATFVTMEWSPPKHFGGRSDINYEVECKQCSNNGEHCDKECDDAHEVQKYLRVLTNTSTLATVKNLTPYTYYQFKVYAKNGVSKVAEDNKHTTKFAKLLIRTEEGGK